ncbi:Kelch repeat-containing protein [Cohnella sp. 56]|uniref:Kelch repeat-containing protein n=1 Tax=Cohnella sp. 56 TaxID=3113722 RepID=UPI0030E832C0
MKKAKVVAAFCVFFALLFSHIGSLSAADTWVTKASMSLAHAYGGSAVLDGKLYAVSGEINQGVTNIVEAYDFATNTWSTKANYPISVVGATAVAFDNKIYVFSGSTSRGSPETVQNVYEYDPNKNIWTSKANIPTGRVGASAVVFNNKIYVIGGMKNGNIELNVVEVYDPATNTWSTAANLNYAKFTGTAFVYQNKLFFLGDKLEEYNLTTNTWVAKLPGFTPSSYMYSVVYQNDVYVTFWGNLLIYDPINNVLKDTIAIPETKQMPFIGLINNSIIFAGSWKPYTATTVGYTIESTLPNVPTNLLASPSDHLVSLEWSSIAEATSYNVKRSTTAGGPYTTIATGVTGTTYNDNGLTNGTKYYYVVTAVNTGGESGNSNEASAIPTAPVSASRALLTIHLVGGAEKEYDLSATELDNFLDWTESATQNSKYKFIKTFNKGPFKTRAEYVVFGKIVNFDVDEYDPTE